MVHEKTKQKHLRFLHASVPVEQTVRLQGFGDGCGTAVKSPKKLIAKAETFIH